MSPLRLDVWSDIACPWCYVGKRKLERALKSFEHAGNVEVVWRSFELNPSSPLEVDLGDGSYIERLAAKYNRSPAEAAKMIENMTQAGADIGIEFRFDRVRPGSTFDAHRLLHLAHASGQGNEMKERLLRAYMTEGELVSDHAALVRLAGDVGLDPDSVQEMLRGESFSREVRADEAEATAIGCRGVPFFVFASEYAVPGAQPEETLLKVLRQVWEERAPVTAPAEVCDSDGCELPAQR